MPDLTRLLSPRSVAIVGASPTPGAVRTGVASTGAAARLSPASVSAAQSSGSDGAAPGSVVRATQGVKPRARR